MKKPTRAERRAMIERGKSIAIVVLCLCCAFFLYSIWNLYKGQVSRGQAFWETKTNITEDQQKITDVTRSFKNLTQPCMIMVGQASARAVLEEDSELFVRTVVAIDDVMKNVYSAPATDFQSTDVDMWQSINGNGIIYAKYPCVMESDFEKHFISADTGEMATVIEGYDEIVIIPHSSADNGIAVFVRDKSSLQTYKVEVNSSAKEIRSIIAACSDKKNNTYLFAHELNLDEKRGEGVEGAPVVLDSMFIIPMEKSASAHVTAYVPETYIEGMKFSHTNEFTAQLLTLFGYNPNTVRRYAKDDGTVFFVGDTGNLSLYPDGRIEYKSLGESEGIPFAPSGKMTVDSREILSELLNITASVFEVCDGLDNSYLRITQMPNFANGDERIEMEYFNKGKKVILGDEPAVVAVIENGEISELKMTVKIVEETEETSYSQEAFAAIDQFCEENPQCRTISGGELVYKIAGVEESTPAVWLIRGE